MSAALSIVRPAADVMLESALEYVRRGLRVVPVHTIRKDRKCSCGDAACATPGKHPCVPEWQERGTTETGLIAIWFTGRWQGANVGIVTGAKSGVIVLDEDPRNGGDDSLDTLVYRYGRLPDTLVGMTGGGGNHYYFQHPGWAVPNKVSLLPGLDVKGDNGLAVAPPSVHESGDVYDWDGMNGFETPIASAPDWLLRLIHAGSGEDRQNWQNGTRRAIGSAIPVGQRNDTLASIAGYLRRLGAPQDTIMAALAAVNGAQCEPPLPERELRSIAKSVARYAPVSDDLDQMPVDFSDLSLAIAAMPASVAAKCAALRCNVPGFAQVWNRRKKMAASGWFPYGLAIAGFCTRAGLSNADTASILAQHQRDFGQDYESLTVAETIRLLARARLKRPATDRSGGRRRKDGGQ